MTQLQAKSKADPTATATAATGTTKSSADIAWHAPGGACAAAVGVGDGVVATVPVQ